MKIEFGRIKITLNVLEYGYDWRRIPNNWRDDLRDHKGPPVARNKRVEDFLKKHENLV